jgi:hypothetical protein
VESGLHTAIGHHCSGEGICDVFADLLLGGTGFWHRVAERHERLTFVFLLSELNRYVVFTITITIVMASSGRLVLD